MSQTIYVYDTEHSRNQAWQTSTTSGKGLVKIGQTTGSVEARIQAQLQGYPCTQGNQFNVLFILPSYDNDFDITDRDIHKVLQQKGFYRLQGTEWFGCTVDDIKQAINEIMAGDTPIGKLYKTIYDILLTHRCGLTIPQLSKISGLSEEQIKEVFKEYVPSKIRKDNRRNLTLRTWLDYYTLKSYPIAEGNLQYHPYIPKTHLQFLHSHFLTLDNVIDMFEGRKIYEIYRHFSARMNISLASAKVIINSVRKGFMKNKDITVSRYGRYYRVHKKNYTEEDGVV